MKRSAQSERSVKRLKSTFAPYEFPTYSDNQASSVNFHGWALGNSADVCVSNGTCEFQSHKRILATISPFFKTAFEGDAECEVLQLKDITDKGLEFLERFIYIDDYSYFNYHSLHRCPRSTGFAEDIIKDIMLLTVKYDINLVGATIRTWFRLSSKTDYESEYDVEWNAVGSAVEFLAHRETLACEPLYQTIISEYSKDILLLKCSELFEKCSTKTIHEICEIELSRNTVYSEFSDPDFDDQPVSTAAQDLAKRFSNIIDCARHKNDESLLKKIYDCLCTKKYYLRKKFDIWDESPGTEINIRRDILDLMLGVRHIDHEYER